MRIHFRMPGLVVCTATVLSAGHAMAQEVEIVRDGRCLACIVLPANAHAPEKEAADDLREAVRDATGVSMDIYQATRPPRDLIPIRIASAATGDTGGGNETVVEELDGLPYDGAVIRATAEAIDIAGPTPAGTANGVASVLIEDMGARTYYPDPLFTIVPKAGSIKIRSRVTRPSFGYRVWSGLVGPDAAAYRRRNRLSDLRTPVPYFGFGHNLGRIIPVEKYGESHPEYFAFRNGARRPEGKGAAHATQPCFTNAEVIKLTVEAARRFFDEHPERNTFSLCVNDNPRYCECETCSALDKPYRDLAVGRQYSESYYHYVSEVAEAIARSHPDRCLGVYAYWNVEQPPRNRKKLPGNVVVALTLDILQHYDPAYRKKDRALIRAWSGHVDRLHTYVYYGLGWFTPRTSPRLVAEDLRFAAQNNVRAIYCESYPFWAWCGPMYYVATRLQWDVNADVADILDEFHRDCFGKAAAQMRAFHRACEHYWERPRPGKWFEGLDHLGPEEAMADVALLREAQGHLEEALARAGNDRVRRRILWLKNGFDFTMAIADAFEARKAAGSSEEKIERLFAAAKAVEAAHGRLIKDPAYKHTYYLPGRRFESRCWDDWFKDPMRLAAEAYWKDLHASLPETQAASQWESFKRRSGLGPFLDKRGWELAFDIGRNSKE